MVILVVGQTKGPSGVRAVSTPVNMINVQNGYQEDHYLYHSYVN